MRLNIFSSAYPSKVLLDGASSSVANKGEGLTQPQGELGRLTQLQPRAQPRVRDQAGNLRPAWPRPLPARKPLNKMFPAGNWEQVHSLLQI